MTIVQEKYYGWNGFRFESKDIVIRVIPELGGRIISLQFHGHELLYVDPKRQGETFKWPERIDDLENTKKKFGFRLWGGDKTWIAPESAWIAGIPPLHLDAGEYTYVIEKPNAISMTSPIDQETGLRLKRRVAWDEEKQVMILDQEIDPRWRISKLPFGIWDVTQILRPFDIYFPANIFEVKADVRFAASLHEQQKLLDSPIPGIVRLACKDPLQFKYSSRVREGFVAIVRKVDDGFLAMTRYFAVNPELEYPHGNSMIEIYNSGDFPYFELEVLGANNQTSNRQVWSMRFFDKSATIEQIITSNMEKIFL